MKESEKPIANPYVMLREEFDDWAVLFNPDTGHGFGLSPIGVYLWKLLDGEHNIDDVLKEMRAHVEGAPEEAGDAVGAFIDALIAEGLAGFDRRFGLPDDASRAEERSPFPSAPLSEMKSFTYEPPMLVDLRSAYVATGQCSPPTCVGGTSNINCSDGCLANATSSSYGGCNTGTGANYMCSCGMNVYGNWCYHVGSTPGYENIGGGCSGTGCSG